MVGFVRFLSYHNAVPIALSVLILSFGAAFASSEEARESVFSSESQVVSVDNTYIANIDLNSYSPRVEIAGVTEDGENYYIQYRLRTVSVVDAVWRDTQKDGTLTVAKSVLGEYGDLGLYVTEQFKQLTDRELAYLQEVQQIERRSVTPKVVATEYSGLVGRFLDTTMEELPGYMPVVTPPPPPPEQVAAAATPESGTQPSQQTSPETPATASPPVGSGGILQILGNNPAEIPKGAQYVDLGVFVSDPQWERFGVKTWLDDREVTSVIIDTSIPGEHVIRYVVTNDTGSSISEARRVIVFDPNPAPIVPLPPEELVATTTEEAAPGDEGVSTASTTPVE